jgi:uncharacterized glyoxalase superfamily protein PhnB
MPRSFHFYHSILRLKLAYGGENETFSSFEIGGKYLNLQLVDRCETRWGRIILHCSDVDDMHRELKRQLVDVDEPQDGAWGERYFHIKDPDGHELSIAKPIKKTSLR